MVTLQLAATRTSSGGHGGEVSAVAYTPDSRFVLSGGWDGHLRLWEASQGAHVTAFRVSEKPVSACAAAPDGKEWLSGSLDGLLGRWDAVTQQRRSTFLAHPRPVSAITFSPDGSALATASWDRNVILWGEERDHEGKTLSGHGDIVAGCRFTPDGKRLLSWSYDGTVRLWDAACARPLATLEGHEDRVLAGAVSPDGRWAASGSRDGVLKLWDLKSQREAGSVVVGGEVRACCFLLDARAVAAAGANGCLTLHAVPDLAEQTRLETGVAVECGELAPSGARLALGCGDGLVRFVAVEGFDSAPLVVTATQTSRRTQTRLQRLMGKSRLILAYLCTCPACQQPIELTDHDPEEPASCPGCRRRLRLYSITPAVEV